MAAFQTTVTIESFETRQMMSVNPAVAAVQTSHAAELHQPLTVTRAATASRTPVSVITVRNTTENVVNYQVEWEDQTSWTTYSVQPHHSKIFWHAGQMESATIRYDASFAAGFQGQLYGLSSKPFVLG